MIALATFAMGMRGATVRHLAAATLLALVTWSVFIPAAAYVDDQGQVQGKSRRSPLA